MHTIRWTLAVALLLLTALSARAHDYRLLVIGGVNVKWGGTALGSGADVTYGFVESAAGFPGATNCRTMVRPDAIAVSAGTDRRGFEALAAAAFGLWSAAADIEFRPARAGETPDILIGAQGQPRGIAFANVWNERSRAAAGVAPLTRASVCLNPTLAWTAGRPAPGALDLGTVLAHEIGHAIGLDHPGPTGTPMGYRDQGNIDHLMAGDVAGAQRLYGPPR